MMITCILQGTLCDTGIPCTLYGGNICSVLYCMMLGRLIQIIVLYRQVQGTCLEYTLDQCEKDGDNGPFETQKGGELTVCQTLCLVLPGNCTFFIADFEADNCYLYNYPLQDFVDSCKIYAGTPTPGIDSCAAEEDSECFVSQLKILTS